MFGVKLTYGDDNAVTQFLIFKTKPNGNKK